MLLYLPKFIFFFHKVYLKQKTIKIFSHQLFKQNRDYAFVRLELAILLQSKYNMFKLMLQLYICYIVTFSLVFSHSSEIIFECSRRENNLTDPRVVILGEGMINMGQRPHLVIIQSHHQILEDFFMF